ncbi:MAG: hypothetical protein GY714_21685 [Desulfobacterales bacterium]|nr:hypothetical protein [Desulfobacterales bacterium]MCP4163364.1 hypothetical protein [Deltaproteobacteria bacterium]
MVKEEILNQRCFNYSEEYIQAFVKAKGNKEEVNKTHKLSKNHVSLKYKKLVVER